MLPTGRSVRLRSICRGGGWGPPLPFGRSSRASPEFCCKDQPLSLSRGQKARRLVPRTEFLPTARQTFPESSADPAAPRAPGPAPHPLSALHPPRKDHLPSRRRSPRPSRPTDSRPAAALPWPRAPGAPRLTPRGRDAKGVPPRAPQPRERDADPATPPRGRGPRACQHPRKGSGSGLSRRLPGPLLTPNLSAARPPPHSPGGLRPRDQPRGSRGGLGAEAAGPPTRPRPLQPARARRPTRARSEAGRRGRGDARAPGEGARSAEGGPGTRREQRLGGVGGEKAASAAFVMARGGSGGGSLRPPGSLAFSLTFPSSVSDGERRCARVCACLAVCVRARARAKRPASLPTPDVTAMATTAPPLASGFSSPAPSPSARSGASRAHSHARTHARTHARSERARPDRWEG
uniref:Uncharacterized protein n=1 Tax=Rangifer tarandus platyrhynchus TaxID=3082113 RepID=A0ACB0DWX7_RANTA|nr:unnamed protein product [Rangifer tarandus platyrhynchus]